MNDLLICHFCHVCQIPGPFSSRGPSFAILIYGFASKSKAGKAPGLNLCHNGPWIWFFPWWSTSVSLGWQPVTSNSPGPEGNQQSLEEQLDPKWDPTSSNLRNSPAVLSHQSISFLQLSSFHQRLVHLIVYLQVAYTATNHSVAGKWRTSELTGKNTVVNESVVGVYLSW